MGDIFFEVRSRGPRSSGSTKKQVRNDDAAAAAAGF